ncbi:MAG: DUF748 domain-containing protein, partial [Hyphomicrobium sp.]|nr:DUF748 domain-containing protein [Hyphomicrobium sp.]
TQFGAQLAWAGSVTLNPLASTGRIDLTEVDFARLAPLLQDKLPVAPPAGVAVVGGTADALAHGIELADKHGLFLLAAPSGGAP